MQNKNKRYLWLMTGSILVLALVQFFWLESVYKDYKNSLKQETRLLFATTVTGMLDSLVLKELRPVFIPATPDTIYLDKFSFQDTLKNIRIEVRREEFKSDSLNGRERKIRIFTSELPDMRDSIRDIFRPLIQGIDSLSGENKFTFSMDQQTLEPELIEKKFNEILVANGYPIQAKVQKFNLMKEPVLIPDNAISLEEIRIPFGTRIIGYIDSYKGFLIQKMLMPGLFSFLVLIFISWSMIAMYRNMLKQQRLNLLKNDIISNITHELKTPVSTVSIVLESLENFGADSKPETRKEYIQIAKKELVRLTAMAENILKSSVLGKEGKVIHSQVDVDFLVEDRINSFKPILESQSFHFNYSKTGNHFKTNGNEEQLSLVIFNLLDNAIKYSKEKKAIELKLQEKEGAIILEVSDQGIGIPEAYQKEIFEKFIRVPQEDIHDVKGYGLGLAQVSEIVKMHQGKISLKSQVGKGSTFTIQLPKA